MSATIAPPQSGETFFMAVAEEPKYALTRQQFIDVIDEVLETMGAHFRDYEQDRLREFAANAQQVAFGSWNLKPGCPLQQTSMCVTRNQVDSVFSLFIEHFDATMRKQWGLGPYDDGQVTIL